MNDILSEYQHCFRKTRDVIEQIPTLREIQAESSEYQIESQLLFIYFRQAYGRVVKRVLFKVLTQLGVWQVNKTCKNGA